MMFFKIARRFPTLPGTHAKRRLAGRKQGHADGMEFELNRACVGGV